MSTAIVASGDLNSVPPKVVTALTGRGGRRRRGQATATGWCGAMGSAQFGEAQSVNGLDDSLQSWPWVVFHTGKMSEDRPGNLVRTGEMASSDHPTVANFD